MLTGIVFTTLFSFYVTINIKLHSKSSRSLFDVDHNYLHPTFKTITAISNARGNQISVLKYPFNGTEGFVSMGGTEQERVYFTANADGCGLGHGNGYAAGPKLQACSIAHSSISDCDPTDEFLKLDVIHALTLERAVHFFLPDQPWGVFDNLVMDRIRRSSATGIVIIDDHHLVVGSFGMKKVYLYEYSFSKNSLHKDRNSFAVTLLDQADAADHLDLIDFDGNDLISGSLFKFGKQELFKVDLSTKSIRKHEIVDAFGVDITKTTEKCHETALYPSQNARILAAGSFYGKYDDPKIKIRFYDYINQKTLSDFHLALNNATRGFKPKGFRFIDKHHMIASLSGFPLQPGTRCNMSLTYVKQSIVQSTVVLIKMEFSLDDIYMGKRGPADDSEFSVLGSYSLGNSIVEGLTYDDGIAIVADQYNDCVLVFDVNVTAKTPLTLRGKHYGYLMPHGVFMSKALDLMAVSNYGDNSVIMQPLSSVIN